MYLVTFRLRSEDFGNKVLRLDYLQQKEQKLVRIGAMQVNALFSKS